MQKELHRGARTAGAKVFGSFPRGAGATLDGRRPRYPGFSWL